MRPKFISLLAVSALALSGCASSELPEPQPTATSTPSASAESVAQESGEDPALFLKSVNFRWIGEQHFSDEELMDAGHDACEQMRDGVDVLEVESGLSGISDENQDALAVAAQGGFCRDVQRGALKPSEIPDPIAPPTN